MIFSPMCAVLFERLFGTLKKLIDERKVNLAYTKAHQWKFHSRLLEPAEFPIQ